MHSLHSDHPHEHHETSEAITLPFILNVIFTIIEFFGAWITNSMAIFTDAFHDLGDSLSLGVLWALSRLSHKEPDKRYTYGYQRFRLLGVIFTTLTLLGGSIYSIIEGIKRIQNPEPIKPTGIFILAILGVGVNLLSIIRLRKKQGYSEKIVSLHLLEDLIGWLGVLVTSIVLLIVYIPLLDTFLSFILAFYIFYKAGKYLIEIFRILLLVNPFDTKSGTIIQELLESANISNVHDFHMFSLDGKHNIITLHVVTPLCEPEAIAQLREEVRDQLDHYSTHCTIEIEQEGYECIHLNSCFDNPSE